MPRILPNSLNHAVEVSTPRASSVSATALSELPGGTPICTGSPAGAVPQAASAMRATARQVVARWGEGGWKRRPVRRSMGGNAATRSQRVEPSEFDEGSKQPHCPPSFDTRPLLKESEPVTQRIPLRRLRSLKSGSTTERGNRGRCGCFDPSSMSALCDCCDRVAAAPPVASRRTLLTHHPDVQRSTAPEAQPPQAHRRRSVAPAGKCRVHAIDAPLRWW
jgi:hypothetical protein